MRYTSNKVLRGLFVILHLENNFIPRKNVLEIMQRIYSVSENCAITKQRWY